jgi:hypothetical protein
MMAMAGLIQVSDANNRKEMKAEIDKFESSVIMQPVKTRVSDLFKNNIK